MSGRIVRITLLVGLLIGVVIGGASSHLGAQTTATLEAPKWVMGDRWTWRRGSDQVTATVADTSVGYMVLEKVGADTSVYHYALDLSSTDSHFAQFQFPMSIGEQWRYTIEDTYQWHPVKWNIGRKVEAMESVTVPAGTFDTFRVSGHHCNVTVRGCGDFIAWYAPKVKNVAKITWTNANYWSPDFKGMSQVLISYDVHSP